MSEATHAEQTVLSEHVFYEDDRISAGFSRFPTAPGHTVLQVRSSLAMNNDLIIWTPAETFLAILRAARIIATALISLIPLSGVSSDWKPIIHEATGYHTTHPGYITSKNGPKQPDQALDQTRNLIASASKLEQPPNCQFLGGKDDASLFARIVRGELPQWRVWEDGSHVAFLTPFPSSPGFTVLVPHRHLSSDIFGLEYTHYDAIVLAAQTVARVLVGAFEVARCGMIFEGYEIDYAHVKLVPILEQQHAEATPTRPTSPFYETYPGFVTSQSEPEAPQGLTTLETAA